MNCSGIGRISVLVGLLIVAAVVVAVVALIGIDVTGRKDRQRGIGGFVIPSPSFNLAVADDGLVQVVNPGKYRIEAYTPECSLPQAWSAKKVLDRGSHG